MYRAANSILQFNGATDVSQILDRFTKISDVTNAMRQAGLDKMSLIVGIDFTLSNMLQGQKSFGGKSLHATEQSSKNPYQKVILSLGEAVEKFDPDGKIPAFGFGDSQCKDVGLFPLVPPAGVCMGFKSLHDAYLKVPPHVNLSGPTSFVPLIKKAIEIVKATRTVYIFEFNINSII